MSKKLCAKILLIFSLSSYLIAQDYNSKTLLATNNKSSSFKSKHLNKAPVVKNKRMKFNENAALGRKVGNPITFTDPNSTNAATFSIVAQDADNVFIIDQLGQISTIKEVNYEEKKKHVFTIQVNDNHPTNPLTDTAIITIDIIDRNDAPTDIKLSSNTVPENSINKTEIATLSSIDEDSSGTYSYSLAIGTGAEDNSKFTISGNKLLLNFTPDFEDAKDLGDTAANNTYAIKIKVHNNDNKKVYDRYKTFQHIIRITNVNEKPILSGNTFSIDENKNDLALVGTALSHSDVDKNTNFVFSILSGNTDNVFAINNVGQITIADKTKLDYEKIKTYTLSIELSDGTLTAPAVNVIINVNKVNKVKEDANFSIEGIISTNINEDITFISPPASLSGDEPIGVVTYSISSGLDKNLFTINSSTGILSLIKKDFENPIDSNSDNIYQVEITAKDSDNNTTTKTINITVRNTNIAPLITSSKLLNQNLEEDFATPVVLKFKINDTDHDKLTLSLVNSNPDILTAVLSQTAEESYGTYNNKEYTLTLTSKNHAFGSTNIQVIVKDQHGLSYVKNIAINIQAVLDFPNISNTNIGLIEDFEDYTINLTNLDFASQSSLKIDVVYETAGIILEIPQITKNSSDGTSAKIILKNIANKNGSTKATITVTAGGTTISKDIIINVNPINDAPTIEGTPSAAREHESYSWTPIFNDIDNDNSSLTFTASSLPSWASINKNTGEITGTPASTDAGTTNGIIITVNDTVLSPLVSKSSNITVSISVIDVNRNPLIQDSSFNINENLLKNTLIGTVNAKDLDGDTLTYSILSGNNDAAFSISSTTGEIKVADSSKLDFESLKKEFVLNIQVLDNGNGNLSANANITITLLNINEAPSLSNKTFSINENSDNDTKLGKLNFSDPDANTQYTFKINSGNINTAFSINNAGFISVYNSSQLDYEKQTSYTLKVQLSDGSLNSSEVDVIININNVKEDANFSIEGIISTNINEDITFISPPASLSGDEPIGVVTYSISSGLDKNLFTINSSTGILSLIKKDFENPIDSNSDNIYQVEITAKDSDNNTTTKTINITVRNTNIAPLITSSKLLNQNLEEDFATPVVLKFKINDTDHDKLTLSLVNSNPDILTAVLSQTAEESYGTYNNKEYTLTLTSKNHAFGSTNIQVIVKDQHGLSYVKNIAINIQAVLKFPDISNTNIELSEDFEDYTIKLTELDPNKISSLTIDVLFETSGVIKEIKQITKISTDKRSAEIILQNIANKNGSTKATIVLKAITVADNKEVSKNITITVNPVNDAPTIEGTPLNAKENTNYSWTPTFNDIDNDNTSLTFTASSLPSWAVINTKTGEITGTPTLNDAGISENIIITISDGSLSASHTISISVSDVNQNPIINAQSFNLEENSLNGTIVGTIIASDPDKNTLKYSIVSGNEKNAFSINSNTGEIRVADILKLDYESLLKSFYLLIKVTDNGIGTLSSEDTITINLTNVDYNFNVSKTNFTINEKDGTSTFTIKLDKQPVSDVVFDLSTNTSKLSLSLNQLRFTKFSWNVEQSIKLTSIENTIDEGTKIEDIIIKVNDSLSDSEFDSLANKIIKVSIIDDDSASYTVSKKVSSINEKLGKDSFTVVLNNEPLSDVVFSITSNNTNEVIVDKLILTFTPSNWNINQSINISAIDDNINRNDSASIIISTNPYLSDDKFDTLDNQRIYVTVINDDNELNTIINHSNGSIIAPVLNDYSISKLTGVTLVNIDFVNELVKNSNLSSKNDIQNLINILDEVNITKDEDFESFVQVLNNSNVSLTYGSIMISGDQVKAILSSNNLQISSILNKYGNAKVEIPLKINSKTIKKVFNIKINPINDAPIFDANTFLLVNNVQKIGSDGTIKNLIIKASDVDADILKYSAVSNHTDKIHVIIDSISGELTIDPIINSIGFASITIRVEDGNGLFQEKLIELKIKILYDTFLGNTDGFTQTLTSNKVNEDSNADIHNSKITIPIGKPNNITAGGVNADTIIELYTPDIKITIDDPIGSVFIDKPKEVKISNPGADVKVDGLGNLSISSPVYTNSNLRTCQHLINIVYGNDEIITEHILGEAPNNIMTRVTNRILNTKININSNNVLEHISSGINSNNIKVDVSVKVNCDGTISTTTKVEGEKSSFIAVHSPGSEIIIDINGNLEIDNSSPQTNNQIVKLHIKVDSSTGSISGTKELLNGDTHNIINTEVFSKVSGSKLVIAGNKIKTIDVSFNKDDPKDKHKVSIAINDKEVITTIINKEILNKNIERSNGNDGIITSKIKISNGETFISNNYFGGNVENSISINGVKTEISSSLQGSNILISNEKIQTTITRNSSNLISSLDKNGKIIHKVVSSNNTITEATFEKAGSKSEIVLDKNNKVKVVTTATLNNIYIQVEAAENGSSLHRMIKNGKVIESLMKLPGVKTTVKDTGEIISEVTAPNNFILSIIAKTNGEAEHKVTSSGQDSTAVSKIKGAKSTISRTGDILTIVDDKTLDCSAFSAITYFKAYVDTSSEGLSSTGIYTYSCSDDSLRSTNNTLSSGYFENGNINEISKTNGNVEVKTEIKLLKNKKIKF